MTIRIRQALPADVETVVEFNARLAQETEAKTLPPDVLRAGVASALADTNKALYFFAMLGEDETPQGQIMITYEWSDWRNGWFWWIQSVYVRKESRRRGIFRALYDHVRRLAEAEPDVIGLRLYVEHENTSAQQTYIALGMELTPYQMLELYPLEE